MTLNGMIAQMQTGMSPEPAPAAPKEAGDAAAHLKAAHTAHAAGDHKKAKHHAFAAIKAMPKAAC